jgi:hypothetical protein
MKRSFATRRELAQGAQGESFGVKTQGGEQALVRAQEVSRRKGTTRFPNQVTRHVLRELT